MGKTDLERLQRWRKKEMAKGRKNVSVLLSLEATEELDNIQTRTGESIANIIERLLLGKGPSTVRDTDNQGVDMDMDTIGKIKAKLTPEKEQLMHLMKQLRIDQGLSHVQIAVYLDKKEVPTLSGKGTWQQGSVGRILKKWGIP